MATLALISNECMQRRCVELTLCKQWVRLNAYALEFEGFIGVWSSMLCSRNFTLLCCLNTTYNTWYYNGDCACLFVKYMERYHVGTGRTERAFQLLCVCVWILEFIWRRYWCSKHYEIVNNLTFIMCHPNILCIMAMMALLRWSLLVECMEWVSCLPCTISAYVYISMCVCVVEFKVVVVDRWSIRS